MVERSFHHEENPSEANRAFQIKQLMTPEELLERTEIEKPAVIIPEWYPTFDSLLAERERIRTLRLLPVKNDEQYAHYHNQDKADLVREIEGYVQEAPLVLKQNHFPYFLPDDVEQSIIWMRDPDTDREKITGFIEGVMRESQLTPNEVILFERPMKTKSYLVKGTIQEVRHMHFWTRR